MTKFVLPAAQLERVGHSLTQPSAHSRLPRLDFGIDWGSPRQEFSTSLRTFFTGPRPPKYSELAKSKGFRVDWIRGRWPVRGFTAAILWHVAVIWILILPIWGFLPEHIPNLAPVQIELTWYPEAQYLPKISLPAPTPKASAARKKAEEAAKLQDERGADAFHARQTILSIPVRVTHPRQTLIRPDAPNTPPKIVPQLPNIVQWSAVQLPKPKFNLTPTTSAPKVREHAVRDVAAPEVPNAQKNPGPLNIAPTPAEIARPKMPVSAMSAPVSRQHETAAAAAAPEISSAAAGDASQRNLIALSATPGPPMPVANVPEGNLAARISISPVGTKPGAPDGSESRAAEAGGAGGSASSTAGSVAAGGSGGTASSLPASVSISGGSEPHAGGGGIAPAGGRSGRLNLKPSMAYEPPVNTRKGPADVSTLDPMLPPEKILSGSEVYTLHLNRPNLTSASGSWILSFAELDDEERLPIRRKDIPLAAPVPLQMTDPKYPPELIKGHVHGEVVLYAIIRKDGSVDSIQIVRGLDPELDRNAIEAFGRWTFQPARRAGVPVDLEAVIHIPFTYQDPRDYGPTGRP
jgi:TonB family protein